MARRSDRKVKTGSYNLAYEGVLDKIERLYLGKDIESLKPHVRRAVEEQPPPSASVQSATVLA